MPTSLGNPADITRRAVEVLGAVPVIACEDTRTTRRLLNTLGIAAPRLVSYTDHNKAGRTPQLVGQLADGDVALVSEAGMPGISDPGQELVAAAIVAGYRVVPLPGPSAALAALAGSGLPTRRFLFLGFLPRTGGGRRKALREVASLDCTLVVYESPRRVRATLGDVLAVLGERRVVAAREISKTYEEFIRGTASEILARLDEPLGEFTLVIEGAGQKEGGEDLEVAGAKLAARLAAEGRSGKDIVEQLISELGLPRRQAYALANSARAAAAGGS
ncbi:MAG: 16S rRNA (cytidine(1402)-2'-O)-methyltransferase [Dehalococcoidia bacterium]